MSSPRREPDREASGIEVTAGSIKIRGHFRGREAHGRNRAVAREGIEVTVREQHPGKASDGERRPPAGTVLGGRGRMRR